jgi:hypothetical protein
LLRHQPDGGTVPKDLPARPAKATDHRSSITGRFVSNATVARHPNTGIEPALSAWEAEEQELSGLASVGSLDPVEREVGDGVGCVVGEEFPCVVDEGEFDAVGESCGVRAEAATGDERTT